LEYSRAESNKAGHRWLSAPVLASVLGYADQRRWRQHDLAVPDHLHAPAVAIWYGGLAMGLMATMGFVLLTRALRAEEAKPTRLVR